MTKNNLRKLLDEQLISKNLTCTRVIINALDFYLFPGHFHDMPIKPVCLCKTMNLLCCSLAEEMPMAPRKTPSVMNHLRRHGDPYP